MLTTPVSPSPSRSTALDALRGIAIIGMVLSGTIASTLPAWMYHAQVGPRSGMTYDPAFAGITWVDLVFPFFLFAMGAAFPLAMNRKLNSGIKHIELLKPIIKRFLLLCLFAVAIYHTTPYRLGGDWNYVLALVAFILFFAAFSRLPFLSIKTNNLLNYTGMLLLIVLMIFNVYTHPEVFKSGFKLSHNDIIILVLANMALFGSIIWLLTRNQWLPRLAILAVLAGIRIGADVEGSWNQWVWNFNPLQFLPESFTSVLYNPGGWLYRMEFLKYLFIIIPGTIAGDLLYQWTAEQNEAKQQTVAGFRRISLLVLLLAAIVGNLYCMYMRYVNMALIFNVMISLAGSFLLRKPEDALGRLYYRLFQWAVFWLLTGTAFEAYEGGIHKDPATFSYFFLTSALAIFTLMIFSITADCFGKSKYFRYLAECGQNPMVAYVAGTFFVVPLLVFTGLMPHINKLHEITPWFGLLKGLIITGGMMAVTVLTVRKKWFWKT